jgi:hypothetical protein
MPRAMRPCFDATGWGIFPDLRSCFGVFEEPFDLSENERNLTQIG